MRTRWRFGSKRRFVATIEWLRLFPKDGFFPQTAQTLAMARASVAERRVPLSLADRGLAELGEQVGHLEGGANGLGALADSRLGLLDGVRREDTERNGDSRLERSQLEPTRRLR